MSEPQQPPVPPYASGDHGYPPASPQPAHPPAYSQQPGYAQQPGYSQQPGYAQQAGQSVPAYPTNGGIPAASGNSLGRIAFLIALITFVLGVVGSLATPFLYTTIGYSAAIGVFARAGGLFTLIGYAAALVVGIMALRRPTPHLFAGIAIGIAGSGVVSIVFSWIATSFYRFM